MLIYKIKVINGKLLVGSDVLDFFKFFIGNKIDFDILIGIGLFF